MMDSGNSSGSLQSSSGGEDEYDSRAESSFSASFMINNRHNHNHVGLGLAPFTTPTTNNNFANSHTLPPPQQHNHHNNNTHVLFDPLSNYLDPMQQRSSLSIPIPDPNNASLLNLDMMWSSSKPARSEPNPTDLGSMVPSSSQLQLQQQQQRHAHAHALLSSGQTARDNSSAASFHALPADSQQQHEGSSGSRGMLSVSVSGSAANNNNDHQPQNRNNVGVRNPKKRSRASRRAPTTVLTTDTTNFRAMVQEFTGIPAQPFPSTSSPFPRTRFDLFASAPPPSSSSSNNVRSTLLDPSSLPPYLLRPFAQKLHHHLHPFPTPPSSNPMVESLLASNNNSTTNNSTSIADLLKQHALNFNNNNNPILSFQQQPPKYPLGNSNPSSIVASRTQPSLEIPPPSSGDSHLKVGVFEELGGLSGSGLHHQNMVSSSSGNNHLSNNASTTEWAQRTTGTITNDDREQGGEGTLGAATVNYSTNVADRTTAAARSEGMVESWINCSSDN